MFVLIALHDIIVLFLAMAHAGIMLLLSIITAFGPKGTGSKVQL